MIFWGKLPLLYIVASNTNPKPQPITRHKERHEGRLETSSTLRSCRCGAGEPALLSLSLSLCSLISQSSRALALALRIAALSRGGSGSAAPARANHAHGHVAGSGGARQVAGARNAAIGPVAAVAHLPRARPRGPRRLRPAVGWSWWSFTQVRGGLRPFATGRYAMARAVRYTGVAPSAARTTEIRGRSVPLPFGSYHCLSHTAPRRARERQDRSKNPQ